MSKTVLVDADTICYANGFAVEQSIYVTEDGAVHGTAGQAAKHCDSEGLDVLQIQQMVDYEPLANCLHSVKNCLKQIQNRTGCTNLRIFLSGETNFRYDIATIRPYKGNRSSRKPHWFEDTRKYLIDMWGAEVVQGIEADDALGIFSDRETILATIDKDLDMIPGLHYNYKKDTLYDVDHFSALRNFYMQLLTGDTCDNIRGVPGVGKVTARKLLKGCTTEEEMYWTCLHEYCRTHDKPYEALLETARLLWILREPKQEWLPPA